MKNRLQGVLLAAVSALAITLMPNIADAQQVQQGDLSLGAGLAYSSGVGAGGWDNDFGVRVDGYYAITSRIRLGADFTYYFPKSQGGVDMTVWDLGLHGHYILLDQNDLLIYGLAGIGITGLSASWSGGSNSDSEMGLNLGSGLEYNLGFAALFGEIKLTGLGGDADQFSLNGGLRFRL